MSQEDRKKNVETLIRACVVAQNKGAFLLKDASVLHTAIKSITDDTKTMTEAEAIGAMVQGVTLGQKAGAYTLDDANVTFLAVKWIEDNLANANKLATIPEEQEPEEQRSILPKIKEI